MKIAAFGCSHTAGTALDGVIGSQNNYNKHHSFTGLIASKYNAEKYTNMGVPGGSNQFIYRMITKYVAQNKNDLDDTLFLIGWTSTNRFELRYLDQSPHTHSSVADNIDKKYIPFSMGTDPKLYHTGEVRRMLAYAPLLFDEDILLNNWATYAYTVQELCKNLKINFLMYNTCHELIETNWNKSIIDKIDKSTYIDLDNGDMSMLTWGLNHGFEKTKCWHLMEDGHAAWSGYIEENLKRLKYV